MKPRAAKWNNLAIGIQFALVCSLSLNRVQAQCQHRMAGDTLIVVCPNQTQRWVAYGTEALECAWIFEGETHSFGSHAIQAQTQTLDIKRLADTLQVQAKQANGSALLARISLKTGKTNLYYNGKLMAASVQRTSTKSKKSGNSLRAQLVQKTPWMGGGARVLGMDRKGHILPLYNRAHYGYETHSEQMNFGVPLVLTGQKFMIHLDNSYTGSIDMGKTKANELVFNTDGGRQVLQFIASSSWPELMKQWTSLSGRQPLLPLWALGNISSRFGYHSQREVQNTIAAFKAYSIPVEALILDLYWFGKTIKGTMGNLAFDPDSFPDPASMIQELHAQGLRFVPITEPFILTNSSNWNDALAHGALATDSLGKPAMYDFYFGKTGLIDLWDSSGSKWFMNKYHWLMDLGADGFWGDLGEPEVHPDWVQHKIGEARKVHNIYGHEWARQVNAAMRQHRPETRPFILMRAGYSGSQRYGIIPWSGDVNRSWGGLAAQPEISLQMGIQGLAWMHSDLGGFAGNYSDPELYLRWLQYGVFQPIFRPHAQEEVPSEPVFWPEPTRNEAKKIIEMRYSLMPYLIDLMHENHRNGMPLMRPAFFYDSSETASTYSKGYFWGEHIYVCPVLHKGIKKMSVYLPAGKNWYAWEDTTWYAGGQTIELTLTPQQIPVFVAEGALLPLATRSISPEKLEPSHIEWVHYPWRKQGQTSGSYTLEWAGNVESISWKTNRQGIQVDGMREGRWAHYRTLGVKVR